MLGNFIFFYSGSPATLSPWGAVNPAALKIKGSPSDAFNRGKSNQKRELTGIEVFGSFRDPVKNGFHIV